MKRFAAAAVIVAMASFAAPARADDKPNPTGTWKWTVTGGNGQTRDVVLKLKLDGEKLTGAISGRMNKDMDVDEPTFKDGEVSFKVTRDRNGVKTTTVYKGKVDGDVIKGKTEVDRDGKPESKDWEAKRAKD
jgi:hypothetical protein